MAHGVPLRESEEATLSSRGYHLLQKLGEGSYAQVFLAEYSEGDQKNKFLACKIVDVSKAPKDFVKKFLPRELDVLVKISHPHIIHVHSIFQRKLKYYIFMRNAENGDLLEYVLKKGPLSEGQSRVWFRQLALGVQYLHEMEIAHRDLKCENCLITNNYNLKLADFGFARFVVDQQGRKLNSATYCGSLSYAAPEVLKGTPYYPKTSDIWSMGVILYIMINKAMPFDDTNVKRLNEQQLQRKWKFRSKVADSLSEPVKNLVKSLMEPDVQKRFKVDEVVNSEWIAMDPRLLTLNPPEEQALAQARIERTNYIKSQAKKSTDDRKIQESDDIKIFKSTQEEKD